MNDKQVSTSAILISAGMIGLLFALADQDLAAPVDSHAVSAFIDALPASGAGLPSSLEATPAPLPAPVPAQDTYLGGSVATGRVAQVYVKVAENVFLSLEQAPQQLQANGERWVDVQFPDLLANGTGAARAFLERGDAAVQVGDVVEIKFAHKDNPRFFPVKELTRVTELVANRNERLAKDMERRILARNGASTPAWLAQAVAAPSAPRLLPQTTTADTGH
jgi:hypothetical protein